MSGAAIGKCIKLIRFWSDRRIGGCTNKQRCTIIKFLFTFTTKLSLGSLQNQSGFSWIINARNMLYNQGQDQDVHIAYLLLMMEEIKKWCSVLVNICKNILIVSSLPGLMRRGIHYWLSSIYLPSAQRFDWLPVNWFRLSN